jgi:NAD(P)-dependent dehydrogenase (short-subunit alcohol dehydrogenase family)
MAEKVLITGAGRGIGLELTKTFLQHEATVFALTERRREHLDVEAKKHKGRLHIILCDVSNEADVAAAAAEVMKLTSSLDILINNAAIMLDVREKDLPDIDFEAMKKTYDVNAVSPLRVVKHFIGLLLESTRRILVNISSEAGSIGNAWRKTEYGYCMSKAALNMASAILQNRYRDESVKVLALHPGWVRTDMGGREAPILPPESAKKLHALISRHWNPADPIYFDLDGTPMPW